MTVEQMYFLLFGLFSGLSLFFASRSFFIIKGYIQLFKMNKMFKQKQKEREAMLDKGEVHEWVNIPYGFKEVRVCKKTGWCPELNGYLPTNIVKSQLKLQDIKKGFDQHKKKQIQKWAKEFNVSVEKMEELVENVYGLKKTYYTDHAENQIMDMLRQEKFGAEKL